MYSFYGGKEGRSFTIKDRFESIDDMTAAFALGGGYTTAGYGEFVIIDTPNKSDYENGCIFKRGFDYQAARVTDKPNKNATELIVITQGNLTAQVNDRIYWDDTYTLTGTPGNVTVNVTYGNFDSEKFNNDTNNYLKNPGAGAIYIGQIVGPPGTSTPLSLVNWSALDQYFPTAAEGDKSKIKLERSSGKTTDEAKAGYCDVRDANGDVLRCYFAFDLPYDVFELQAESVDPYGPKVETVASLPAAGQQDCYYKVGTKYYLYENNTWIEQEPWVATKNNNQYDYIRLLREKQESIDHPYYHSFDLKVPKGIHGKDVETIGINLTNVRLSNGDIDPSNHNYEWYFEDRDYTDSAAGTSQRIYLGQKHNVIDRITDDSADPDVVYSAVARSTDYEVGDYALFGNQDLILLCSKSGTTDAQPIDLTKAVEGYSFEDGTVIWTVMYKKSITPGLMTIHLTDGTNNDFEMRLISSVEMDDDGRIFLKYTDLSHRTYLGENRSIIGFGYNPDPRVARFYVMYNTYYRTINGAIEPHDTFVYNQDNTDVVTFPFTDANGREIEYVGDKVKFLVNIAVDPTTQQLIATYNTGEKDNLGLMKVLTRIYTDSQTQDIIAEYNTGDQDNLGAIKSIVRIYFDNNDNEYKIEYNTGDVDSLGVYRSINSISVDPTTSEVIVSYNTGETASVGTFKSIDDVYIDSITKRLIVEYDNGAPSTLSVMRTVESVAWDDDFHLKIVYNAADPDNNLPKEEILDNYDIKYIENIYISDEGDLSKEKYIQGDYIIGKDQNSADGYEHEYKRITTKPLNEVVAMKLVGDNLMVLYSSPAYRDSLSNTYDSEYKGVVYKWANLGAILSGNHVFGNYASIADLKAAFPFGFGKDTTGAIDPTTQNRMGWVATIEDGSGNYQFCAYDYSTGTDTPDNWYIIKQLSSAGVDPRYSVIAAKAKDSLPEDNLDNYLNDNGLWFVVTES